MSDPISSSPGSQRPRDAVADRRILTRILLVTLPLGLIALCLLPNLGPVFRTFSMPAAVKRSSTLSRSARVEPTQVKCAMASMLVSALMRETMSMVSSRVDPPAP